MENLTFFQVKIQLIKLLNKSPFHETVWRIEQAKKPPFDELEASLFVLTTHHFKMLVVIEL